MSSLMEETRDRRNQINDMSSLVQTMIEQKNKDVKACDAKSIETVKKIMRDSNEGDLAIPTAVLDALCQFLSENSTSSWRTVGADIFSTEATFGQAVRKCNPAALEKEHISQIGYRVNRDQKDMEGDIVSAMMNANYVNELSPFYPYFKVLFKLVQSGLTLKKKMNLQRQQVNYDKQIEEIKVKIETQKALIKNLDFHKRMTQEAERIQAGEYEAIASKQLRLQQTYDQIASANHVADFFAGL